MLYIYVAKDQDNPYIYTKEEEEEEEDDDEHNSIS